MVFRKLGLDEDLQFTPTVLTCANLVLTTLALLGAGSPNSSLAVPTAPGRSNQPPLAVRTRHSKLQLPPADSMVCLFGGAIKTHSNLQQMDRRTGGQVDRRTGGQADRWTGGQADR